MATLRDPAETMAEPPILRVLAGANAGAELTLAEGDWLIGSGQDADLTFAEPALAAAHLRLLIRDGGIRVEALADGLTIGGRSFPVTVEADLPLMVPLRIGGTVFALGMQGADWTMVAPEAAPTEPPPLSGGEAEEPGEPPTDETAPEPASNVPTMALPKDTADPRLVAAPKRDAAPARRGRWLGIGIAATLVLLLGAGGVAWFAWVSAPPVAHVPQSEPLQQLRAVIRGLGLQDSVSLTARDRGGFAVTGQLRTEEEFRNLSAALRRTGLPVDIAVTSEASMTELAGTILNAFGVDGSVAVAGTGALTVRGFAPSNAAAASAIARLRNEVPGVRTVRDELVTPERARDVLEARLRSAGLAQALQIRGGGQRLAVSGLLAPEQAASWGEIVEHFRREYGPHITLSAEIAAPGQVAPRGVTLGRVPYLVMENGQRVRVGQVIENVGRVLSIDGRRVRVQTSAGAVDIPYARTPNWILEDHDAPTR